MVKLFWPKSFPVTAISTPFQIQSQKPVLFCRNFYFVVKNIFSDILILEVYRAFCSCVHDRYHHCRCLQMEGSLQRSLSRGKRHRMVVYVGFMPALVCSHCRILLPLDKKEEQRRQNFKYHRPEINLAQPFVPCHTTSFQSDWVYGLNSQLQTSVAIGVLVWFRF